MKKNLLSLFLLLLAGTFVTVRAQVPVITESPINISVCVGFQNQVSLLATNASSYRWQLSADDGDHWTNISDNSIFTGATTNTLIVTGDLSLNGKLLRCLVSNANGTAESVRTVVQVDTSPPSGTFFINQVTSVCQGTSQLYYLDGAKAGDSLIWFIPGASVYQPNQSDTNAGINFNGNPGVYTLTVGVVNGCGQNNNFLDITVNPRQSVPAGAANGIPVCSATSIFPGVANGLTDNSCGPISAITFSGTSPLFGTIQSCVTVDASVQSFGGIPYVPRHYSLEPSFSTGTSTATVTLYFTQADFDAYNAARGSSPALPTMPTDAAGIANIHITQFHGTGTTPDTYVGGSGDIDPDDNNIVWNATAGRWEVTFDITGFSGFFVSGGSLIPLPLTLVGFTGQTTDEGNLLHWETGSEENTAYFEMERKGPGSSAPGAGNTGSTGFQPLAKIPAAGNSDHSIDYNYTDGSAHDLQGALSYRLRMVDLDGKSTFSKIVTLQSIVSGLSLRILPNPSYLSLSLTISTPHPGPAVIAVTDISGRSIWQQPVVLQKGDNYPDMHLMAALPKGIYFISVTTDVQKSTVKLIRE
jgi:hypothetical protein